ncbi:MAG: LamG-like jellyroll fold domain-containing protein [Patescibacteria group bacterium]
MTAHKNNSRNPKAGFTVFELLIVVAILAVIGVVIVSVFHNFRAPIILNSAAEVGVSALNDARSKTLSSKSSKQYGVHFASSSVTLFRSATYLASDSENKENIFSTDAEISCISLNGGGTNVVFDRLTGETANYGTVIYRLANQPSTTRKIVILPSGASRILEAPSGMVAYWDFEEQSGNTVYDRTANKNDGTLTNMDAVSDRVTWGKVCRGLDFDGGNDYVRVPAANLDVTGDITASLWVRPSVNSAGFHSSWNYFIYHKDPNVSNTMKQELGYYNDDGPRFKPYNQSGTDYDFSPDLVFTASTWYHVVFVRRGTSLEIYVNGALSDSRNDFSGTLRLTGPGGEIQIGGHGGSSGFIGAMDEVRIYNRALTTDEITRLYQVGL